jgi:hypothetical protein
MVALVCRLDPVAMTLGDIGDLDLLACNCGFEPHFGRRKSLL